MKQVVLYTKNHCPLCDEAKQALYELQQVVPFTLDEIDIYQEEALLEKYQLMIPVVEVDGEMVTYGKIVKAELRKRLR